MKKTISNIFFCAFMAFMCAACVWAYDAGQRRVDAWEQSTGRYGEGLR